MAALLRVSVIVPCYNEEHRLDGEALRSFRLAAGEVTFCLVDDGSRDRTLEILRSLETSDPGRFHVLALAQNSGKAEAVRRGILEAIDRGTDVVGFWDADLATPLSEIDPLLSTFELRPEIEMVFASRVRLLGRDIDRRALRHYLGRVGATLISLTLGLAVYDTQCGAKLFRATPKTRALFERRFISRWIFDVEIIARYIETHGHAAAAAAIYEYPIRVWHDVRGSKIRSTDFLRALGDLWKIGRAYRMDKE